MASSQDRSTGPATMRDVAERAGVSAATVSFAFNQPDKVRPATRARIFEASEQLGYRRNMAARALRTGRHHMMAILVSNLRLPHVASVVTSAQEALVEAGYLGIVASTDGSDQRLLATIDDLSTRGVGAFLLCPSPAIYQPETLVHLERAMRSGLAVAIVSNLYQDFEADVVLTRARQATSAMVAHLSSLGHTRIAWVGQPVVPERVGYPRWLGYCDGIEAAGLSLDTELVVEGTLGMAGGRYAAQQLLALKNPPTAVLATADSTAAGVLLECQREGLEVPRDVSVAGINDEPIASQLSPTLTTMRLSSEDAGATAVRLLVERVTQPDLPARKTPLPFQLQARDSTASP